jgi:hypothetical protein
VVSGEKCFVLRCGNKATIFIRSGWQALTGKESSDSIAPIGFCGGGTGSHCSLLILYRGKNYMNTFKFKLLAAAVTGLVSVGAFAQSNVLTVANPAAGEPTVSVGAGGELVVGAVGLGTTIDSTLITVTDGPLNSTTINQSTVDLSLKDALGATVGNVTLSNTGSINATGTATLGALGVTGNSTVGGTLGVTGASTFNNSVQVDTNGAVANAVGTAVLGVANNAASLGVTNAAGHLNGVVANTTSTVISGGTATTTLTLDDAGATFATGLSGSGVAAVVHGVANGVVATDAVNKGQLDAVANDLHRAEKMLSRGIASTTAIANIPQVDQNKTFSVGVGIGGYNSQNALAVGVSYRFAPNAVLKASVGSASGDKAAYGIGAGWSW